jgi:hypothetical protein
MRSPFNANLGGDRYYNQPYQLGIVLKFLTSPQKRIIGKVRAVASAGLSVALPEIDPTNKPNPAADSASARMTRYVFMNGKIPGKQPTPQYTMRS